LKRQIAIGASICCALFASVAGAALVRTGNLVLTADGGFTPLKLPRNRFAPIDFKGHANVHAVDGGVPAPLQKLVLYFDHDGRLSAGGLPSCDPAQLIELTPTEARERCRDAIVGTGNVDVEIAREGAPPLPASSPITLFNGPRLNGGPTVILHARTTEPATQTFVIEIPIERRPGQFRYRATIEIPPILGGRGSIVHLDAEVGRRYRYRGREHSYVSARCRDGVFRTRGRFTFGDGTVIDGSVEKGCQAR
jgi:hypothetical protein